MEERADPEFHEQSCYNSLKAKNKARNPNKLFFIPPWMKTLDRPKKEVNIDPLMYQKITKVINYMRSSASPSPIDQVSIIMLKNCPITRLC